MKSRLQVVAVALLLVGVLMFGLTGGVMLDRFVMTASAAAPTSDARPDTNLLLQAYNIIQQNYVDRSAIDSQRLTYGAISGMVESLGDTGHTTFLTPQMLKQHDNYTAGAFEGIGAQVEQKGDYVVIVAPMDNSPALKAGLKPGDAILKVNDEDMTGKTVEYVIDKILGKAGTQVTITLLDPKTDQQRDVTITRARIPVNSVTWAPVPGTTIGVLRVSGFSDKVGDQIKQSLQDMRAAHITGVVLDLRNNPGGLLNEAVTTVSQFVASGDALLEQDAKGKIDHIKVQPGGVATDLPVAVLINYGSASASEIVAGALHDEDHAKLFGETTFGTGTVLNTFSLSDGSAMLVATSQWLTPNGTSFWHKGIAPDDKVTLPTDVYPTTPAALKTMTESDYKAIQDTQLKSAVDWLLCPQGNCAASSSVSPDKN